MSSFRIEYWCNEGWHVNDDHKALSPQEYAQIQPHMKNWSSAWRVFSNDTNNLIAQSTHKPCTTPTQTTS